MTATLGEFLTVAERRFAEAEEDGVPETYDHEALAVHTLRMVDVLGRYLDVSMACGMTADRIPEVWQQTEKIRAGLREAGSCLKRGIEPARSPERTGGDIDDPAVAGYARAVNALAVGAEVLSTHMTVDKYGNQEPRSDWPQLLATRPMVTALTEEIAKWGARAERLTARLAQVPDGEHRMSVPDLAQARDKLVAVSKAGVLGDDAGMTPGARRHLLLAVPAVFPPDRAMPSEEESDTQLCAGIGVSAQRLRAAAFAAGREPGNSPALSGRAWRREAHASAVTCDLAARVLQALADDPPEQVPAIRLLDGASCLITAREAWRHVAWMWQAMSTDTTFPVSRTTVEATDLGARLGRLLTGQPAWKPSRDQEIIPRAARSLAPDDSTLAMVVGALHEAVDAVTRTGQADMAALVSVQRAGRLYIQTQAIGEMTLRYGYLPAPADRVHMLKNAYYLCTEATWQAVRRLDTLALDTGAPSRPLALARAALPAGDHVADPETGFELDPDVFAGQLELFTRLKKSHGRKASEIDPDAVIRAYRDESLTLEEVGHRFATSAPQIARILAEHKHPVRSRSEAGQLEWRRKQSPKEEPPPAPEPAPDERSPLYRQLRQIGITDPALLLRAAAVDKAGHDVLRSANQELQANRATPARGRSAAELAALDDLGDASSAVASAADRKTPEALRRAQNSPRTRSRRP